MAGRAAVGAENDRIARRISSNLWLYCQVLRLYFRPVCSSTVTDREGLLRRLTVPQIPIASLMAGVLQGTLRLLLRSYVLMLSPCYSLRCKEHCLLIYFCWFVLFFIFSIG